MARIRTIKPEFQQSAGMGRVSRDARLTFILLWPQCDDSGRARANSRMLASVLFPYDEDAPKLITGWLDELENVGCITRYTVDDEDYLAICHWEHQKIDHPTPSKLPAPPDKKQKKSMRKPRENSVNVRDLSDNARAVSSTVSEGNGEDQGKDTGARSAHADEQAVIQAYSEIAEELNWPIPKRSTARRRAAIKATLRDCGGVEGWRAAMAKARASPYLRGETVRSKGYENWTPDLDFFLQESSFTKLMEGKYDQRGFAGSASGIDAIREGARRAAGLDGPGRTGMGGDACDDLGRLALSASR